MNLVSQCSQVKCIPYRRKVIIPKQSIHMEVIFLALADCLAS